MSGAPGAGTIDVGKRADLVLFEKNPLTDITNTWKINGVMIKGRWLKVTEIEKILGEMAVFYKTFKKQKHPNPMRRAHGLARIRTAGSK